MRARLVSWFAFLGPLGNLIPIPGTPHSFRFYYFLLPVGVMVFLYRGVGQRYLHRIALLGPFFLYVTVSAGLYWLSGAEIGEEGNPVMRAMLFIMLALFTLLAADYLQSCDELGKVRLIRSFLNGYFYSLLIGYVFFVGYYGGLFGLEFLEKFHVLVQFGYGILRFSPGSYPNEYGIVSSFVLSLLTLLLIYRNKLDGLADAFADLVTAGRLIIFYVLTLVALFLTTTRAAYIAYILALLYIFLSHANLFKSIKFAFIFLFFFVLILVVAQQFYDIIGILMGSYEAIFDKQASAYERLVAWESAYANFLKHPILGTGFGSSDMIHNTYLQLFFGLGIGGVALLLISMAMFMAHAGWFNLFFARRVATNDHAFLLGKAKVLAIIHIAWFAVSNHNLNHFLTWFGVLLVLISTRPAFRNRWDLFVRPA